MIKEKEGFYRLKREFSRLTDYALRQVVLMTGQYVGRYIGPAPNVFVTDILLPDGTIHKDKRFNLIKVGEEEQVHFEEKVGGFSGVLTDNDLEKLRFKINFNSD